VVEQVGLIVTGPGHVAVRPQQRGGDVEFLAEVDDVVDPVCPVGNGKPAGLVEQQSAARCASARRGAPPPVGCWVLSRAAV